MTDHDSGAKDTAEGRDIAGVSAPNVVPFPRAWYGSVDELVPIDPVRASDSSGGDPLADASAFWSGDTSTPTLIPTPPASSSAEAAARKPATREWAEDELEFAGAGRVGAYRRPGAPSPRGRTIGAEQVRAGVAPRRVSAVLALVLVVLIAGLTALVTLRGGGSARQTGKAATARQRSLIVTQTIPQTTTVVQTITSRGTALVRPPHRKRARPTRHATKARPAVTTPVSAYHPAAPSGPVVSSPSGSGSGSDSGSGSSSGAGSVGGGGSSSGAGSLSTNGSSSGAGSLSTSGSSSRGASAPASGGGTPTTSGSSRPSCAPSATNGGACSL